MANRLPVPGSLTSPRLARLLRRGETDLIEYKGRRASFDDIVEAVVCFANGQGGLILWGVNDDGTVSGASIRDPQAIRKNVFHSTAPSQRVEVQAVDMGAQPVVAVWVAHSPVLVSTRRGGYHERLGTECVPMTPDRLVVRQIDVLALDFSAALTPVGIDGADELEVQRYRQLLPPDDNGERLRRLDTRSLLLAIGALRVIGRDASLTVGGLLVFGREDEIRETLPQHQVVYLRTPSGATDYERRVVTSAPVLRLLDQLMAEISAASRTRTLRVGPRDLEVPDYPERVLREAIVNAIAHRHYTLPGDTVIRQTATQLELENPGGFPEGIAADTVIQHAPVHRNRHLCEILDRVRLMERSGLGVDRIFEDQIRFGKLPPSYEADRTSVRLRLDASEFDEAFARFVIGEEQGGRVWRVEDLLVACHLRRMGPVDRATLASVMQRPDADAQDVLGSLLGSLIDRFGTGPGTRYALSARVQAMLGAEATFTRERGLAREAQRNLVLQHADQFGRVDNKTVRELLQITQIEATNLLRTLEARGHIRQIGNRRWAYYEPAGQRTLAI